MTDNELERLAMLARAYIAAHSDTPRDTGNLAASVYVRKVTAYQYEIYIDLDRAPYQEYLNDRPNTRNGSPNKHYQWWEKMRVNVARYLQELIIGGYNGDAIDKEMEKMGKILSEKYGGSL